MEKSLVSLSMEGIALITPPSSFLLDERVFVNLGILKIAAVLEKSGIKVEHLDLSGVQNYLQALTSFIENTGVLKIGITTTTPQLPAVVNIIKLIRRLKPHIRIILGGPHVTLTHSAVKLEIKRGRRSRAHQALDLLSSLADVLVSGDGEKAIFHAIQNGAPRIIDADEPKGGLFLTHDDFEQTPFPARHLVDIKSYKYEIEGRAATSLIAQLGCPFACGFCGGRNSKSLRFIRTRSSDSIIEELRHLNREYGYTGFMFYDDELNVNKEMLSLMAAISNLQDELGVEFRLRGFIKSQLFTEAQAKAMYQAGFRWILTGFESGSPRILENMNKKATLDENTRTVEIAKRNNLKVKALMSLGHPGDSEETALQTQDWLLRVQPDDFDCTIITTYPGTPYYDEATENPEKPGVWTYTVKQNGDRLHANDVDFSQTADFYKGDPNGGYRSFVFTDYLSSEEIVKVRTSIESTVRAKLNIPYPKARAGLRFEHSMGQGINLHLPSFLYNETATEHLHPLDSGVKSNLSYLR